MNCKVTIIHYKFIEIGIFNINLKLSILINDQEIIPIQNFLINNHKENFNYLEDYSLTIMEYTNQKSIDNDIFSVNNIHINQQRNLINDLICKYNKGTI